MHMAQASNLVEKRSESHGFRLCRKHVYGLFGISVAATGGWQVENAIVWDTLTDVRAEPRSHLAHA